MRFIISYKNSIILYDNSQLQNNLWTISSSLLMTTKTCLLVTDDSDDHQAFSEAASEISESAVVLIILDSQKALQLLKTKSHQFDYIFLDLFMNGMRINSLLKVIQQDLKLKSKIIVYGDEQSFSLIENKEGLTFFEKEYEYSELKNFLKRFFDPSTNLFE